jgi:hypothetical protein
MKEESNLLSFEAIGDEEAVKINTTYEVKTFQDIMPKIVKLITKNQNECLEAVLNDV